ncbi:RNA polymerase sigma factor [Pedobacter frigidisoli]|uniref:RNA polymerase sigma factor n=1 Tax=Pedobacter frigidisoli TaxID=2530455 RepID=UPI002930F65B|nr:sigma-70 family RNA polymerase sigma factor [Pedobacter frigidisoli]
MYKELESNFFYLVKLNKNRAFQLVFDAYWSIIFNQAYKKVNNTDVAKDLAQEVFVCLWDKIDLLDTEGSVLAYLYAILKNRTLKLYAHDDVKLRYANKVAKSGIPADHHSQNILLEKELKMIIDDEVMRMPARMKEIYLMKKEDDLSIREIAEELSLSEQTIKNQLQTAYQRLRLRVSEYDASLALLALMISRYMS